jgi:hypothetical protein
MGTILGDGVHGVNDMIPTNSATIGHGSSEGHHGGRRRFTGTMAALSVPERTLVDVRIGVTQTPREISLELADDSDRAAIKSKIEAALTGAVDVLWLTDKKGRDVGISAAKIAFVELGAADGERRIGFGG